MSILRACLFVAVVCASCTCGNGSGTLPPPVVVDNGITQRSSGDSWNFLPCDLAVTSKGVPHIIYSVYPRADDDRTRVVHAEKTADGWSISTVCGAKREVHHDSLSLLIDEDDLLCCSWLETNYTSNSTKVVYGTRKKSFQWTLETVNSTEIAKRSFPIWCLNTEGEPYVAYFERSKTQEAQLVLAFRKSVSQTWSREIVAVKKYVPLDLRFDEKARVHILARLGERLVLLHRSIEGWIETDVSLGKFQYAKWNRSSATPNFFVVGKLGDLWGFHRTDKSQGRWSKLALPAGGAFDLGGSKDGLRSSLLYQHGHEIWIALIKNGTVLISRKLDTCAGMVTDVAIAENGGRLHCAWIDPGPDGAGKSILKYNAFNANKMLPALEQGSSRSADGGEQ